MRLHLVRAVLRRSQVRTDAAERTAETHHTHHRTPRLDVRTVTLQKRIHRLYRTLVPTVRRIKHQARRHKAEQHRFPHALIQRVLHRSAHIAERIPRRHGAECLDCKQTHKQYQYNMPHAFILSRQAAAAARLSIRSLLATYTAARPHRHSFSFFTYT